MRCAAGVASLQCLPGVRCVLRRWNGRVSPVVGPRSNGRRDSGRLRLKAKHSIGTAARCAPASSSDSDPSPDLLPLPSSSLLLSLPEPPSESSEAPAAARARPSSAAPPLNKCMWEPLRVRRRVRVKPPQAAGHTAWQGSTGQRRIWGPV